MDATLGLYKCAQGAICTFIPELNQALLNFEKCVGHEVTITCGNDSHKPTDPHMRGEAVDIGHNSNPWLTRDAAEDCFKKSFPQGKGGSFGQQEYNSDDTDKGWHFHFQYYPGVGGATGFAPGIRPHGK
jgi:hypothetical protein